MGLNFDLQSIDGMLLADDQLALGRGLLPGDAIAGAGSCCRPRCRMRRLLCVCVLVSIYKRRSKNFGFGNYGSWNVLLGCM
mgnify:CR=1 FL=1